MADVPVDDPPKETPPDALKEAAPTKERERGLVAFDPDDPVSLYMDTAAFEQLQRVAGMMCRSALVPEHFRGKDRLADCALVAAQAFRWRMDPFAVVQHVFVHRNRLGYEGKLIAGLINSSPKLQERLNYTYSGPENSLQREVVVTGRIRGETNVRTVKGSVEKWHTLDKSGNINESWRDDADQMLAYRGARQWARRHMPEAVLGILSEDEAAAEPIQTVRTTEGVYVPALPVEAEPAADPLFEMAKEPPPAEPTDDERQSRLFE